MRKSKFLKRKMASVLSPVYSPELVTPSTVTSLQNVSTIQPLTTTYQQPVTTLQQPITYQQPLTTIQQPVTIPEAEGGDRSTMIIWIVVIILFFFLIIGLLIFFLNNNTTTPTEIIPPVVPTPLPPTGSTYQQFAFVGTTPTAGSELTFAINIDSPFNYVANIITTDPSTGRLNYPESSPNSANVIRFDSYEGNGTIHIRFYEGTPVGVAIGILITIFPILEGNTFNPPINTPISVTGLGVRQVTTNRVTRASLLRARRRR